MSLCLLLASRQESTFYKILKLFASRPSSYQKESKCPAFQVVNGWLICRVFKKIMYNIRNWKIVNWPTIGKIPFNVSPEWLVNTLLPACDQILGSTQRLLFICCLVAPGSTLGHCWCSSLNHLMLITAYRYYHYDLDPKLSGNLLMGLGH